MDLVKRLRKSGREWLAAILGVATLGFALGTLWRESRPRSFVLRITAGSARGLRHQIARRLAEDLAARRIRLEVIETSGSEEARERVNAGMLDLALVQGGLASNNRPSLRQVAALHLEPLHLLVKGELYHQALEGLEALKGKVINLSQVGSGTHDLAIAVLAFAGMTPGSKGSPGDFIPSTLSYRELEDEKDRGKLPDAVFMVSALPSPVARELVAKQGYRLVAITFGEAFALDSLRGGAVSSRVGTIEGEVEKVHLSLTEIPAYTYGVAPAVPPRPVATIGTRLLLIAHEGVDPEAVERILETVYSPSFATLSRPPLDARLLETSPELDWHAGTLRYLERNKPLIAGDVVDFMEKGTSLLGAVLGGLFFLWQWWRQRFRRKRDLGFEAYMLKVASIERQAQRLELSAMLDLKELLQLQAQVSALKNEALEKFADGEIEGKELISGFVSHVNDARNNLTRLILHERDNIEERAWRQKRSTEELWQEALGGPALPSNRDGAAPLPVEDLGP